MFNAKSKIILVVATLFFVHIYISKHPATAAPAAPAATVVYIPAAQHTRAATASKTAEADPEPKKSLCETVAPYCITRVPQRYLKSSPLYYERLFAQCMHVNKCADNEYISNLLNMLQ